MDFPQIVGKSIALVVWNKEKDDDVRVFLGEIIEKGKEYFFVNNQENWNLLLDASKFSEIRVVREDLKEMLLGAELYLSLIIANLPDENNDGFSKTGMNWTE